MSRRRSLHRYLPFVSQADPLGRQPHMATATRHDLHFAGVAKPSFQMGRNLSSLQHTGP